MSAFELASDDGRRYRIELFVPAGPAPASGWPSLFIVDATASFGTAVEAMQRMSPRSDATGVVPMVLVGVTLVSEAEARTDRQRELTTPRPGEASGGAPALLRFLDRVIEHVAGQARLDARRRTLFGHSLAGFFVSWVLVSRAESFTRYAAISPSIWWDRDVLFDGVAGLRGREARVLLAIGEWEDALPPWVPEEARADIVARRQKRQMLATTRDFAARLAGVLDAVTFVVMPDEDHASIVSTALPRALRLASFL